MKRLTSFKPLWFFLLLTLVGAIAAANHTTKRGFVAVEGNDKIPTSQNHTAEQEHIALVEPKCMTPPAEYTAEQKCMFVRQNCADSEDSPGVFNYMEFFYCNDQVPSWLKVILLIFNLVFLFVFLGTAASDYFCPNLSTLAASLRLPPDVAGVTFLALGNSAPDLFSSLLAINKADSMGMALGALIGSGLFVGGTVVGFICVLARSLDSHQSIPVELDKYVFIRDVGFLFVGVVVVGAVAFDGVMHWWEGLIMLLIYVFYIALVIWSYIRSKRTIPSIDAASIKELEANECIRSEDGSQVLTFPGDESFNKDAILAQRPRSLLDVPCVCEFRKFSSSSLPDGLGCCMGDAAISHSLNERLLRRRLRMTKEQLKLGSLAAALEFSDAVDAIEEEHHSETPPSCHRESCDYCKAAHGVASKQGFIEFCQLMAHHYFPILFIWRDLGTSGRLVSILNFPAVILLGLTVPVVSSSGEDRICKDMDILEECTCLIEDSSDSITPDIYHEDSREEAPLLGKQKRVHMEILTLHTRSVLVLQALLAPVFAFFALGIFNLEVAPKLLGWELALCVSATLLCFMFMLFCKREFLKSAWLSFIGFAVGICWIYLIANEVVGLLKAFGFILSIKESILGITVFAFGNSVGDFVSNLTMSRMGYPTMAVSASFAGPLINLLVSLGVSGLLGISKPPVAMKFSFTLFCSYIGLFLMLLFYLIYIPLNGYKINRKFGYVVLSYYTILVVGTIVLDLSGFTISNITFGLLSEQ